MQRQTTKTNTWSSTGAYTWTAPAGVTEVLIEVGDSTTPQLYVGAFVISVVPNTSYVLTINSTEVLFRTPNTLGSVFSWTGGDYLKVTWVE